MPVWQFCVLISQLEAAQFEADVSRSTVSYMDVAFLTFLFGLEVANMLSPEILLPQTLCMGTG